MSSELEKIEKQLGKGRNYGSPPLHLWHPELSGDIAIRIAADGKWFHEGTEIVRESIVRLFASILRREDDGEYYLLTPGEKWRIRVDLHPLLVIDVCWGEGEKKETLQATLNTGKIIDIDKQHPLFLEPRVENIAALELPHGLTALFSRNAWYRLVEMAEHRQDHAVVVSGGQSYILG
ncbi:MAG: DUF1285 domain-containing protein [Proteobacteria bacterium]|nr:DUF1285 domain-containing protein [Pseudomonadota bacterium]